MQIYQLFNLEDPSLPEFLLRTLGEPGFMDLRVNATPEGIAELWYQQTQLTGPALFCAWDEGRIVGMAQFVPTTSGTVEAHINVLQGYRGRGLGEAILREGIAFLEQNRLVMSGIVAFVPEDNGPSLRLFGRLGFEEVGRLPMAWVGAGGVLAKVIMWRAAEDAKNWVDGQMQPVGSAVGGERWDS